MTRIRMRNLTLHVQGAREVSVAADAGYDLEVSPEGAKVGPGRAGLESAAIEQADRLYEAAAENSSVLIGGHTGLWVRCLDILRERGVGRPPLAYFDTRRVLDSEGRFVFEPHRLVII